jgi:hypothetical protein
VRMMSGSTDICILYLSVGRKLDKIREACTIEIVLLIKMYCYFARHTSIQIKPQRAQRKRQRFAKNLAALCGFVGSRYG